MYCVFISILKLFSNVVVSKDILKVTYLKANQCMNESCTYSIIGFVKDKVTETIKI